MPATDLRSAHGVTHSSHVTARGRARAVECFLLRGSVFTVLAALCLAPGLVRAEFKIDWSSFGGPSGQSTGGVWTVSGASGAGAGAASGGSFTLSGGYWSLLGVVPTAGAPILSIARAGNEVRLSWPRSAELYVLQETPTLTGTPAIPWTPSTYTPQTNASEISVTFSMPAGTRFFRLQKP